MAILKPIHRKIIICVVYFICTTVIHASNILNCGFLTINESPNKAWIYSVTTNDSEIAVSISANNMINDSTYAGWISIDPNVFINYRNNKINMTSVDGIAVTPNKTHFDHANQTITFSIKFPYIPIENNTFDLIENDSSNWKFIGIELHKPTDNKASSIYYAPHIYARMVYQYTDSLMRLGEYDKAIVVNSNIVSYIKQKNIKADNLLATLAYNLAGCYNNLRNNQSTLDYCNILIQLYESNHWKDDISLARIYGVLADVYSRSADYHGAIQYGEEALRIKKGIYSNGSSDLALTYGKVASYYENIGDYDKSISYAEKGLLIREHVKENKLISKIPVVINLCRNYFIKQRYADALELAMAYKTEATKKESIDAYINLCAVCSHSYQNMGNEKSSKIVAKEGFDLLKKYYSNDQSKLLNFLNFLSTKEKIAIQEMYLQSSPVDEFHLSIMQNLAGDYFSLERFHDAIKLQKKCLVERETLSIRNKAKECEGQNRLLNYYYYSGDIGQFNLFKNNCFNQTETIFGIYSYEYADLLRTSFFYLYDIEHYYEAYKELNKMIDVYKYLIIRDFSLLSYDDRELLWRSFNEWFDSIFLDCHIHALDSDPSKVDELNAMLYDNILFSKGLLLNSQVAHHAHEMLSNSLRDRIDNSDAIKSFLRKNLYGSFADIAKALDKESMAIEFIHVEKTKEIIALCLLPEKSYPTFEFVCKEDDLEKLINNQASIDQYNNLIWSNLSQLLTGKRKIYISLDGILNIIPVENYATECNLFDSRTRFFRLSSTRNLIHHTKKDIKEYLLVGGLNYGHVNNTISFEQLPETLEEIEQISKLLEKSEKKHTIITGAEGTKEKIETLLQSNHSAIHLATHSFYWEERKTIDEKVRKMISLTDKGNYETDTRLVRSGIILSLSENNGLDNNTGILTSYDIAGLNLYKIGLVVLPNCKSGIGDITKDGIIGLQRAFKEAQAGTIIMSLWNADEISTRLLMVEFYRNYLFGTDIHQSLHIAQNYIKNYKDENGIKLFESPYYWAGFIMLD